MYAYFDAIKIKIEKDFGMEYFPRAAIKIFNGIFGTLQQAVDSWDYFRFCRSKAFNQPGNF